jgi:uncharacterized GH25 family protein
MSSLQGSQRFSAYFRLLALLGGITWAGVGAAHDFWVQPSTYRLEPAAEEAVTLLVGHGPARQRSPIAAKRIIRFEAISSSGARIDLRDHLHVGGEESDGAFHLPGPGTYVLVLETDDRARSYLPAIRFNDYLAAEGLTSALELRARLHRTGEDGSENYSRVAKSILQVGAAGEASQALVTRPIGLPLEIVLDRNPYSDPRSAELPVRVLYGGRPLPGALVKLTNLEHDALPVEIHRTDGVGRASFNTPAQGTWLLNVIWTKVQPASRDSDFETTFSSLTFALPSSQRSESER